MVSPDPVCGASAVHSIPKEVATVVEKLPELTSNNIGTFPDFNHCIQLSPNAVPFVAKTRLIPYAIQDKVKDAVRLLDEQGIWELADKGDWAHPLVTPHKPDGTVRITTDLS